MTAAPELDVLLLAGRFEVRGASRQTIYLAEHLPRSGVSARIVCPDASILPPDRRQALAVRELSYLESPVLGQLVRWSLARELRERPPDLIHVQQRRMLPLGRWLARVLQCPYVLTIHDYLGPRETLRIEWHWCRRIIAVSESVKEELKARAQLPDERITVIRSGVETNVEARAPQVLLPDRAPVVGTAGPLEAAKGLRYFLDAVPLVLKRHPDVEFLIAGAGPEEHNLRRQARELNIVQHVTFVPNVLDLVSSLEAMDVFVLPSLKQGLGTIMLEAMVRGRPVIATRAGGVYSVVSDGHTGLLVPPRDSAALAQRVLELLDDPLRARHIGDAARDMVRHNFDVDKMVERTADLYREVAGSPRLLPMMDERR